MKRFRLAVTGVMAVCATALATGTASAMPVSGLANAASEMVTDVQNVRWVCGPFRCWWRPSYYPVLWRLCMGRTTALPTSLGLASLLAQPLLCASLVGWTALGCEPVD
jgi:hypothetical protein